MIYYRCRRRTRSALSYFLRCDCEDVQHLDHYFHDYVSHRVCRRHCGMRFEALKEVLDTVEEIDQSVLACLNIFGRL